VGDGASGLFPDVVDGEEGKEGKEDRGDLSSDDNNYSNDSSYLNTDSPHRLLTGIQYIINSAIIHTREHLKGGGKIDNIAKFICQSTIARLKHAAPAILSKSTFPKTLLTEVELAKFASKVKTFGASGKRSKEQATAAAAHAAKVVSSLPKNSIQAWTDGSKLGKSPRGPTGGGAMIVETGMSTPLQLLKYHLGCDSTNQAAELWAIGGALATIRGDYFTENTEVHVFSDSKFSIDCITGVYTSKKLHSIAKHVIALVNQYPKNTIFFHHVAGHAGIPGNEIADGLANEGATFSKHLDTSYDLPNIARTFGFNHQLIREEYPGDIT